MNSFVLSMPRWFSTKLRTAASTSTARLRPAATGIVTLRIGTASTSWNVALTCSRSRSEIASLPWSSRWTMSRSSLCGRTAVSPKIVRQLALADRRRAGDQHAELQHVEEHAVERRRLREHPRQVDAEDVDDVR